ncbi:MAG: PadR family transcriptional regulator [Oligoflexia bacterium]|nr:PadR family transcriptional regulator [Oligoflexia bacterium]
MKKAQSEFLKSSAEFVVLGLLARREMHGYEILKQIESESRGVFAYKEGTLYPLLHRLEGQGSIEAYWEATESARKRRYYRITRAGRKLLQERKSQWAEFRAALDQLVTERAWSAEALS